MYMLFSVKKKLAFIVRFLWLFCTKWLPGLSIGSSSFSFTSANKALKGSDLRKRKLSMAATGKLGGSDISCSFRAAPSPLLRATQQELPRDPVPLSFPAWEARSSCQPAVCNSPLCSVQLYVARNCFPGWWNTNLQSISFYKRVLLDLVMRKGKMTELYILVMILDS